MTMSKKIPTDFPKIWPYNKQFSEHIAKAISLQEKPSSVFGYGVLMIIVGFAGMFIFGFFAVHSLAQLFALAIPIGIVLAIIGNKQHKKEFTNLMSDVKTQVDRENILLKSKALVSPKYEEPDDIESLAIMEAEAGKHYTSNWLWVRNKMLQRDGYACCCCGRKVQLADSVAHHIAAFSEGGKTEFSNLVTICVECHSLIHPWLNPRLNIFWINYERGRVYCWKCHSRLDTPKAQIMICSDCGWLCHIDDGACGCNYPQQDAT
jgi:hypothetical protein